MHTSLTRKTNSRLLALWAAGTIIVAALYPSAVLLPALLGMILGLPAGALQARAVRSNSSAFARANTATEVRAAFRSTPGGRHALALQWAAAALIAGVAFWRSREPFLAGFVGGYLAFMLTREGMTLSALGYLEALTGSSARADVQGPPAV